uniref:TF-B3 domain-containing protein n=1 Tax=Opuntia streptacantha TaxID=393608 RepID=A0A7C8ZJU3_OPUST
MGSSENKLPRFFKPFLADHCSRNLRIPDAFQDHITGKIPNRVIIKNGIGKLWPVQIVENGDGLYFQGGWSRFVLDNSLQEGEFMVFKYNGHHVFEVLILGINGCERELTVEEDEEGGSSQVDNGEVGEEMEKGTSKYSDRRSLSAHKSLRSKNLLSTVQKKDNGRRQHRFSLRRTTRLSSRK